MGEAITASFGMRSDSLIPTEVYLCIDNTSAARSLASNTSNHEFARNTIVSAIALKEKGWAIRTVWTPAHVGIPGNEAADEMAKRGALDNKTLCTHSRTAKTWLLAQRRQP